MPSGDKPQRLPRGRHGLPRKEVTESQRRRILEGMIEVVAERGYPNTRVVDIISRAGVSRQTFYELFDDKEDCFLAAYATTLTNLVDGTGEAFTSDEDAAWGDRIRLGLAAFLEIMSTQPDAAKVCIVDVLAAGPKALARRDAAVRQFTTFIEAGRSETERELPGITALSLAGGINELIYSEILRGACTKLFKRLPEIVFWTTQPFLGSKEAERERRLAAEMVADGLPGAA